MSRFIKVDSEHDLDTYVYIARTQGDYTLSLTAARNKHAEDLGLPVINSKTHTFPGVVASPNVAVVGTDSSLNRAFERFEDRGLSFDVMCYTPSMFEWMKLYLLTKKALDETSCVRNVYHV